MAAAVVLDFETEAIQSRPVYPPKPVGVALRTNGKSRYYAWGHPTKNNCTKEKAAEILKDIWASPAKVVCHNSKFDLDVAETHFGLPMLPWQRIADTMLLLFLFDPHAKELGLKPSSERLLGMPPDEQDAVRTWLVNNGVVRSNDSKWGAHIADAPGDVVGKYAIGDVERTYKLWQLTSKHIKAHNMQRAYERELRLLPILLKSERAGVRVDVPAIEKELPGYEAAILKADDWVRKYLKAPELNLDSNDELVLALEARGYEGFLPTATGKRSAGKESLNAVLKSDQRLLSVVGYRSRMMTCTNTFMRPWLEKATGTGRVFPNWHQVRNARNDNANNGARTGRIICTDPNLLNLSKNFEDKGDGYTHPAFLDVPELPLVRRFMLPEKGHVWGHRDYNQQELRILAHYEDGDLCAEYGRNPKLDVHDFVKDKILEILGVKTERRQTKTLNFGLIYGMGVGTLAERMGVEVEAATALRKAQRTAIPGLGDLEKGVKQLGRSEQPIVTWGGREYYTEPAKTIGNQRKTYEYKLLNYLIQGSAADCTKEAVIRHDEVVKDERFLVTVYDEVNISMPKRDVKGSMQRLREVMEGIEFDVPMLSDGKTGPNWGELSGYAENT